LATLDIKVRGDRDRWISTDQGISPRRVLFPARDHRERAKRSIVVGTDDEATATTAAAAAVVVVVATTTVVTLAKANFCFSEKQIKRPGNNGVSPSFLLVAGPLALLFALRNQEEELISLAVYRWACFEEEVFLPREYVISIRIFSYKYRNIEKEH